MTDDSVMHWFRKLREQDGDAARRLWERFFARLVGLARQRLAGVQSAAYDAEDVALSAFDVFCRCVHEGRYAQVGNRDELWSILAAITLGKARDRLKAEFRQKRGGPRVTPLPTQVEPAVCELDLLPSRDPGPEFEALMGEECRRLLNLLGDCQTEQVVLWRLEGYTIQEIADKLGRTRWSVRRMLDFVRETWRFIQREEKTSWENPIPN
ncbi:MAG: ECF-type sigma factor [Planctomycetota bacterium]|nr:ECF-type sigma factor [Planctomycetota bacterium]